MINKIDIDIVNTIKHRIYNRSDITIEITITNKCNCKCKYCFEQNNIEQLCITPLEKKRQIELLVQLCNNFDPIKYNKIHIVFWGGEPMYDFDYVQQIILSTIEYDFVDYFLYSNGTLTSSYDKLIASSYFNLIKNRFEIQLSYDGEPHHTMMRGNNSSSIFKTVKLLLDNNCRIKFKATLSFDMIHFLPKIWLSYYDLYNNFGDCVQYSPTLDTCNNNISDEQYNIWKNAILQITKYEYNFILKHKRPLMSWYNDSCIKNAASCNLTNHISIDVNGDIFICHGCHYSKDKQYFKLNNTNTINSLYEVINHNFNIHSINNTCKLCGATFCNVCHITQVNPKDYISDWNMCKSNNVMRCKFFKYFGKMQHSLTFALSNMYCKKNVK